MTLPGELTVDAASLAPDVKYTLVDYNGRPPAGLPTVRGLEDLPGRRLVLRGDRLVLGRDRGLTLIIH